MNLFGVQVLLVRLGLGWVNGEKKKGSPSFILKVHFPWEGNRPPFLLRIVIFVPQFRGLIKLVCLKHFIENRRKVKG